MAIPWLRILDAALGLSDFARTRRLTSASDLEALEPRGPAPAHLETRLAGVVIAALKEVFNRDSSRLEFEREQIERERERAERALRLELLRQTGERELGRLRLMALVAAAGWLVTLVLGIVLVSGRVPGSAVAARVLLAFGWALLLGALAASFVAQSAVGGILARLERTIDQGRALGGVQSDDLTSGVGAALVPWLIVIGFALIAIAVLVA